eukprot:6211794-Pleurochrysis_carterae.AAC.3
MPLATRIILPAPDRVHGLLDEKDLATRLVAIALAKEDGVHLRAYLLMLVYKCARPECSAWSNSHVVAWIRARPPSIPSARTHALTPARTHAHTPARPAGRPAGRPHRWTGRQKDRHRRVRVRVGTHRRAYLRAADAYSCDVEKALRFLSTRVDVRATAALACAVVRA